MWSSCGGVRWRSNCTRRCYLSEPWLRRPFGGLLTTVIYLMLSYTLLVAYISKSGEVLSLLLHVPNRAADLLFTVALGGLLGVGGAKMADSVNQILTIMLLGEYVHSA